jgi:hypothetical protein
VVLVSLEHGFGARRRKLTGRWTIYGIADLFQQTQDLSIERSLLPNQLPP